MKSEFVRYSEMFLAIVAAFKRIHQDNSKVYFESNRGSLINVKPSNFRILLKKLYPDEDYTKAASVFRELGYIISEDDKKRFTNVQRHNNKIVRVISLNNRLFESVNKYH